MTTPGPADQNFVCCNDHLLIIANVLILWVFTYATTITSNICDYTDFQIMTTVLVGLQLRLEETIFIGQKCHNKLKHIVIQVVCQGGQFKVKRPV